MKVFSYLPLFMLIFLAGCSPDEREQSQQEQRQQQLQSQLVQSNPEFDSQLEGLLNIYFDLKDALVESDPVTASSAAESLISFIEQVGTGGLTPETLTIWETYAGTLAEEADRMIAEEDVEQQRLYFETLSEAMIDLVKTFQPVNYTVYHQSCPMVRDGSADWLSREEQIANPYHGDRMMRCGEIIERI